MTTKVFIDLGHGGYDSGATGNGLLEKNVVLDLGLRMKRLLEEYKDVEIKFSRTTDTFLSLSERTRQANDWGADVLVSLHCNASTSSEAKGFETFIYNGPVGAETVAFQNVLHEEIAKAMGTSIVSDRGKKRANFHMCRESKMSAVLTENLFVSNKGDSNLLKNDAFLEKTAQGHVNGLEKFLGLERNRPPTDDSGELFQVIAGTFSKRENAENQVKRLNDDGYSAYITRKS